MHGRQDQPTRAEELPVDPDIDLNADRGRQAVTVRQPRAAAQFRLRRRGSGSGRFRPLVLLAIAGGGFLGGLGRYAVELAMPAPAGQLPWGTFFVNVGGTFVLALLLVLILEVWPPTRYIRPFSAVGFLGAFTTFSTATVQTNELLAHGHLATATLYLGGELLAGLAAASFGLVIGRSVAARRTRTSRPERG